MARLHFTFMQSLATQFTEFQHSQISLNSLSIWQNTLLSGLLRFQIWHFFWHFTYKLEILETRNIALTHPINILKKLALRFVGLEFWKLWKQLRLGRCRTLLTAFSQRLLQLINLEKIYVFFYLLLNSCIYISATTSLSRVLFLLYICT